MSGDRFPGRRPRPRSGGALAGLALALATGLAAGLAATLALAASPAAAEEILFKCYFDGVCDPDRMSCGPAGLDLRFRIDTETNAVEALGGTPTSTHSLVIGDRALTIVEAPVSGGASTTTIPTTGGWAVHSVNGFDGATLAPKQYFGQCAAL